MQLLGYCYPCLMIAAIVFFVLYERKITDRGLFPGIRWMDDIAALVRFLLLYAYFGLFCICYNTIPGFTGPGKLKYFLYAYLIAHLAGLVFEKVWLRQESLVPYLFLRNVLVDLFYPAALISEYFGEAKSPETAMAVMRVVGASNVAFLCPGVVSLIVPLASFFHG